MTDDEKAKVKARLAPYQFKPGQSGNPSGYNESPSRTKLGRRFLSDLSKDWDAHGTKAITAFRTKRPHDYVRMVASLLPRELNVKVNEFDELTDEQLSEQLGIVMARLQGAGAGDGEGDGATGEPQSPDDIPTLQ